MTRDLRRQSNYIVDMLENDGFNIHKLDIQELNANSEVRGYVKIDFSFNGKIFETFIAIREEFIRVTITDYDTDECMHDEHLNNIGEVHKFIISKVK